jgi:hypothetical protein
MPCVITARNIGPPFANPSSDHRPCHSSSVRHRKKRITLIISRRTLNRGRLLLDERVHEHESLTSFTTIVPFDRLGSLHHLTGSRVQPICPLEIAIQAMPQTRRLTHINDASMSIFELVRPGLIRNRSCRRPLNHFQETTSRDCTQRCGASTVGPWHNDSISAYQALALAMAGSNLATST